MLNYTPLKIAPTQNISKQMLFAGGVTTVFAFGILGFLAWTLNSIQSQNIYLADRLETYTSAGTKTALSQTGEVAGAETAASVLPPEAETTRKKVESMIIIPVVGDIPTFALIDDLAKVKNEAFFTRAQVGDHLFVYPKSKMAILYRPSALKIVNVADINQGAEQSKDSSNQPNTDTQENAVKQEVSEEKKPGKKSGNNSTVLIVSSQGVEESKVSSAKETLAKIKGAELVEGGGTSVSDSMTKNRVVNISGKQSVVDELISEFGAEEGPLPEGFSAQDADIVLILAKE